jgi:hypothetical protein
MTPGVSAAESSGTKATRIIPSLSGAGLPSAAVAAGVVPFGA